MPPWRPVGAVVAFALIAMSLMTFGLVRPANAEPVYELIGNWGVGTPAKVKTGETVNAQWWFNVNDDQAAPDNTTIDNVVIVVTARGGVFPSVPAACLKTGVSPASSISSDGTVLTCNVGAKIEGSAVTLTSPLRVTATSGGKVSAGAVVADQGYELTELDVENDLQMDIRWQANAGKQASTASTRDVSFNWTLFHGAGSPAGPNSVSYTLTLSNVHGDTMELVPGKTCTRFDSGSAEGHPYSGTSTAADRTAPFPTCSLTRTDSTTYVLTISNIDYSHTVVPTRDSKGGLLPVDMLAVASGEVHFRILTDKISGTVSLTSSAPTYTAGGLSASDDPSNNSSSLRWTSGYWNHGWNPPFTGSSLNQWTAKYRLAPGTVARATAHLNYANVSTLNATKGGVCIILDTAHATFVDAYMDSGSVSSAAIEYFINNPALLDPASASYDPNDWTGCGQAAGWTNDKPANLSTVKAVRATWDVSAVGRSELVRLRAEQKLKPDLPAETQVWTWGAYINQTNADNNWVYPNRALDTSAAPGNAVMTPDLKYPYVVGGRDVLLISSVTPAITKTVNPIVVDPGGTATYTLNYSANGSGSVAPSVNDYQIVDTLPLNATYVPGSATPEPAISSSGGHQVLTWTLDGVTTNTNHTLNYDVRFSSDSPPGQRLVNNVAVTLANESASASSTVTINDAGTTRVVKSADQAYIPNLNGDGVGVGSWTVRVISQDPNPQNFVDVIDVLPYANDGRGTSDSVDYRLSAPVVAPAGATVYYTTAPSASISDDPADPMNGRAPGDPTDNELGWTTTFIDTATAVRVIFPTLAPFDETSFQVSVRTNGMQPGDVLVNRAQGRAENTQLVMRSSALTTIANSYSASLRKEVQDRNGTWIDANDPMEYPSFRLGETVRYRVTVTNTGQGTLHNIVVTDDQQPTLGGFVISELAPGASKSHEYEVTLTPPLSDTLINSACATAAAPFDADAPNINCDPAGILVRGEPNLDKEFVSATPIGGGQWQVVYHITVTNLATAPTTYTISDVLKFAPQIDIVSAQVTGSPAGVTLATPAWDGQANTLLASNVALPASDHASYAPHVYEVTVIADVPLSLPGVGGPNDPSVCGADGDTSARAFTNEATLTNPEMDPQTDRDCAPVPSLRITKNVIQQPIENGDGSWTARYMIEVFNEGGAAASYDLSDTVTVGGSLTLDSAAVTLWPAGVTTNPAWDGTPANATIATGVNLSAGSSHTYVVEARFSSADPGVPQAAVCQAVPDPLAMQNTGTLTSNGQTASDEACVQVGIVVIDKSVASGPTGTGNGTWVVEYDLTVTNPSNVDVDYELRDQLDLPDGVNVVDATIEPPSGLTANNAWTGFGSMTDPTTLITSNEEIEAGDTHVWTIRIEFGIDRDVVDPADLWCPPPGSGAGTGLVNNMQASYNGVEFIDSECVAIGLIDLVKSISSGPVAQGDGSWALEYRIDVTNIGGAETTYDLFDELRYGAGVVIESISVTQTPVGVPVPTGWTGRGSGNVSENQLADDVVLGAGEDHTYLISVVVRLDETDATPTSLECATGGIDGGLANTASATSNGETITDDACASLPLLSIAKSIAGAVTPVAGMPGRYDVTYHLVVTNSGAGAGTYDLDDELAPGAGITVVGVEGVTTDVVGGVPLDASFDGIDNVRIVTGQPIAGATGAPVTHTYTVTVRYDANLGAIESLGGPDCVGDTGTVDGALHNVASVSWNSMRSSDDACVQPGRPTIDKELVSATPAGSGRWNVSYRIVVGNVGIESTTYDLDDEFLFAPSVTAVSTTVTGPAGVAINPGFDGDADTRIATGVSIVGLDDPSYEPHVYLVDVVAEVPMAFDPDDIDPDGTGAPGCLNPAGSNLTEQGLNNAATLTGEGGWTETDTDCASLPSVRMDKSISSGPTRGEDGTWSIGYVITVTNDGDGAAEYDLVDQLRYGSAIDVVAASITEAPAGVTPAVTWTGRGADGAAENVIATGVAIDAGHTHTYRVQVAATVDEANADDTTWACPDAGGSSSGGFANSASVGSNGRSADDAACASPTPTPTPEPPAQSPTSEPGDAPAAGSAGEGRGRTGTLAWTGGAIGTLTIAAVAAMAVGAILVGRRRRTA